MNEFLPNCIGYAYFVKGISKVEQYRRLPYVFELSQFFVVKPVIDSGSEIITVIRGNKKSREQDRLLDKVEHMVSIDNGVEHCSHRIGEGADIDHNNADSLLSKYFDDRGLFYFLYLTVKK